MATFKHLLGGNVQSRRVIVENGYPNNDEQVIVIEQPANSQVVGGHFRAIEKATVANAKSVGIEVGTTSSGSDIFADGTDSIADAVSGATEIPVGFFLDFATGTGITSSQFSGGNSGTPAVSDGYTADARPLYVTIVTDGAVTAATGETAKFEVQLDFKMLGS